MKFLAEQVVMELRGDLPTAIIRPSIIESSFSEPEPGWLGGFRMCEPLIVGFGKGRLPDFPADPDIILDIVPVDFVVNAILAAAEATAKRGGIEVYHVATGTQNPLYFRGIFEATYEILRCVSDVGRRETRRCTDLEVSNFGGISTEIG